MNRINIIHKLDVYFEFINVYTIAESYNKKKLIWALESLNLHLSFYRVGTD